VRAGKKASYRQDGILNRNTDCNRLSLGASSLLIKNTHLHIPVALLRAIQVGSQHMAVGNILVNSKQVKISFDKKRDLDALLPTLSLTMVQLIFSTCDHSSNNIDSIRRSST
jgi:hypothetical protein